MYKRPDNSEFGDVGNFHLKFGLPVSEDKPQNVSRELWKFRLNFLLEELMELMEAVGGRFVVDENHELVRIDIVESQPIDHPQAFDSLIDLVYIAYGTAHLAGYPWHQGWAEVQEANMAKERAAIDGSNSKRGSSFDVVKPEGWRAPEIDRLLWVRGWRPDKQCALCLEWFHPFDNITVIDNPTHPYAHLHCKEKQK